MATNLFTEATNERANIFEFSGSTFTERMTSAANAINAGNNISVYIPRGTYQLTADIPTLTGSQFEIFGEGQATQIFAQSGGTVTRFFRFGDTSTRSNRGRVHSLFLNYNNSPASTVWAFKFYNCQYIHVSDIFCSGFAGVAEFGATGYTAVRSSLSRIQGNVSNGADTNGHIKVVNAARLEFNSIAFSDRAVGPRTGALILLSTASGGLIDDMRFNDVSFQTFSQDHNHAQIGVATSTTGTGTITLGSALSGNKELFSHAVTDGETVYYRIDDGANFEEGLGVYTASGTTLTRDTILDGSSGAGNPITLSGSGVEVTVPADGKPSGLDMVANNGNIVNCWINDLVVDHTTEYGARMRGTGSNGFTNINFDGIRVSTDAGDGIDITNGSSDIWRDITINNPLIVIDSDGDAVNINTTSTGKFYDCHLTNAKISESDASVSKTRAIRFQAEGGWRVAGCSVKQRSGTSHGFNNGLQTTDTGLERFMCVDNDFSAVNTLGVTHATYAAVSKSRYFANNLGPDGPEVEPPPTITAASTVDLSTTTCPSVIITGTTAITSFGTDATVGTTKTITTATTVNITNSGSLVCPADRNMIIPAGHQIAVERVSAGWVINSSSILPAEITIDLGDETTDLTTGTAKHTIRMPYAMNLTDVRALVTTAPTDADLIVDINEAGTTILSTKLSIDDGEKSSFSAATPAVISDPALADDAEITIDIDQIGSTVAGAGLKVTLIGWRA
jgi:hypothetical protein